MILRLVSTSPGIDKVISLSLRSSVQNVNYQTDQQPPYPLAWGGFAFYSFSARSRNAYHKVEISEKLTHKHRRSFFSRTGSVLKFDGVRQKLFPLVELTEYHRSILEPELKFVANFASCVIFFQKQPVFVPNMCKIYPPPAPP